MLPAFMRGLAAFILAVVSLGACLLSLAFWVLSYTRTGGGWHATYGDGKFCLFHLDPDTAGPYATEAFDKTPDHSGWWVWQNLLADGTVESVHTLAGFRMRGGTIDRNDFHPDRPASATPFRLVEVPFWSLTVATGVLPLVVFAKGRWRRRRAVRFACPECGYDRRGLPPGTPCPECGTVLPAVQSAP